METPKENFLLYSAADLSSRRHRLINKGQGQDETVVVEQQTRLAEAAEGGSRAFCEWFRAVGGHEKTPALAFRPTDRPMTGQEVANPPLSTERYNFALLRDLPPRLASLPSFWTSYQVEMVRRAIIDPADLAVRIGSSNETGRARLQKALRRDKKTLLDQCTRTILRQLGGLPEERGKVSVFVDCRLSRGWWRGHLSHQVAADMELDAEEVWNCLRLTDAPWDQLFQHAVRRLTVLGDRPVRSAAVARLMRENLDGDPKTRRARVQSFLAQVGSRCAYQALGTLPARKNLDIFLGMDV